LLNYFNANNSPNGLWTRDIRDIIDIRDTIDKWTNLDCGIS
jgi:hypothetical protein